MSIGSSLCAEFAIVGVMAAVDSVRAKIRMGPERQ